MGASWYLAKAELRRRSRPMLLLVLLVGVAAGAVLTTVAGARRSATAYERFREETLASDLDVAFDGPPDVALLDAATDAARALPEVAAVARTDFPFIVPADSGFYPYLDFLAAVSVDGTYGAPIDRARILDGRLPDAGDPEEMAIVETFADEAGLAVGDRVEFESFAPPQLEPLFTAGDAGPPAGPRFTFVVTAILDAPTFLSESSGDFTPRAFLSPAFPEEHGDEVATYLGGFSLRLRGGAGAADEVTATLREMYAGERSLEITPATEVDRKIDASIDVIVTALALCALAAALAGAVAIAQALARHFANHGADSRWLAALGMTPAERVGAQAATAVPIALLGAAVAVVMSVIASPLMPVGVARRAEPDPGVSVDVTVLVLGFLGTVVAVLLLAVLASASITRRARRVAQASASRPSRSMALLRRANLAPAASTGVGMALEPRGGTTWAVRSAVLGVGFGIAGLVAVAVFVASADELVDSPARYGSPFDAVVSGFSGDVLEEGGDELLADPQVARLGLGVNGLARVGGEEVNSHAFESLKGDMSFTLLEGHAPSGGAEVVLGATTSARAGVGLGDEVEIEGLAGSLRATVVGTAVFPVVDERSSPGRGVLLGREDFEAISSDEEINSDVLIDWADDVDAEAANAALAEQTGTEVFAPRLPSDVNNLKDVEALPRILAIFLALLATLAVIHALVSTVRMRRQEIAVLRTLGFERRQLSATLSWQATTIGAVGLAIGVPLGLVVGRVVWRAVAGDIGVVDDPLTPTLAVVALVLGTLAVLNLAAVVPGRSARRVAPAVALRST